MKMTTIDGWKFGVVLAALLVLGACGDEPEGNNQGGEEVENQQVDGDGDSDGDGEADSDGDADIDGDADTDGGQDDDVVTLIVEGPDAVTAESSVSFTLDCEPGGCTYECGLAEDSMEPCDETVEVEVFEEGAHTFFARAYLDGVEGDLARWEWTYDATPPTVVFTEAPGGLHLEDEAMFEFACPEESCTFECALDYDDGLSVIDGAWESCASPTTEVLGEPGMYHFRVKAIDEVGNEAEISHSFDYLDATGDMASRVSSGGVHSCVIDEASRLYCWGANLRGQLGLGDIETREEPTQVEAGTDLEFGWQEVSAGAEHTCALRFENDEMALYCWGMEASGRLGVESTSLFGHRSPRKVGVDSPVEYGWRSISAGGQHTCGIRHDQGDRTLWCWGSDFRGQLGLGSSSIDDQLEPAKVGGSDWLSVSAGGQHTCGIRIRFDQPMLQCWGRGEYGRLGGGGMNVDSFGPQDVETPSGVTWRDVAAGGLSTCALAEVNGESALYCWGLNSGGMLGTGDTSSRNEPVRVGENVGLDSDWTSVTVGDRHSCGVRVEDDEATLYCWGDGEYGRHGLGSTADQTTPMAVEAAVQSGWRAISAGSDHSCGLREEAGELSLYCWGWNAAGRIGQGESGHISEAPTNPSTLADFDIVEAGESSACGIKNDGTLWCWGEDLTGILGLGVGAGNRQVPTQVAEGTSIEDGWTAISLGHMHACGIRSEGGASRVYCWGNNFDGQLGLDNNDGFYEPQEVGVGTAFNTGWTKIAVSRRHSCGLREEAGETTLWCWGANDTGQLGIGDTDDRFVPTKVSMANGVDTGWESVTTGSNHTCAIHDDSAQTLWCWGWGADGQLGLGVNESRHLPAQVGLGTSYEQGWSFIHSSRGSTCGIHGSGTDRVLRCWGQNSFGELGLGDTNTRSSPTQVGSETDWNDVSVSPGSACGIRDDDGDSTLWCWGTNGIGEGFDDESPTRVGQGSAAATGWSLISVGIGYALGVHATEGGMSWGLNNYGQLGNGQAWYAMPVPVIGF